jgi:HlyD family secretion protein
MMASAGSILMLRLKRSIAVYLCLLPIALSGCSVPKDDAGAQNKPPGADRTQATAVDVAIAATVPLASTREYTGTTQPFREVAIRFV